MTPEGKELAAEPVNNELAENYNSLGAFDRLIQPCIAEFVGVLLFVFIGTMSVQDKLLMPISIAHGFTIAVLIIGMGHISGGHFNPAVTLGVFIAGDIHYMLALGYFVSQILGGLIGAGFTRAVMDPMAYNASDGGAHTLGMGITPGWGILCEVLLTTLLVLTVLMSAVDKRNLNKVAPLAIGFAVAVDILAGGNTSGASMNPARSFGPAVVVSTIKNMWKYHYVYWIGPGLGGLVAGLLFRLFLAGPKQRWIFKGSP